MVYIYIYISFQCDFVFVPSGVNPAPLMDLLGVPAQYVDPIRTSTASHVAVGYAGYKVYSR